MGDKIMRLIETVTEFASYGIQNHVNADLDGCANEPEVANSEPLRCRFGTIRKYRVKKDYICEDLLQVFETACRGDDPRWKLVHIYISGKYEITFKFSDMEAVGKKCSERGQSVTFTEIDNLWFDVEVKRPGHDIPDRYSFDTEGDRPCRFDKHGEKSLMHITEERNGKFYANGVIFQRKNGKYYFMQQQYD